MHRYQRTGSDYKRDAEALAEAVEKQQIACRSASLWQALLEKSGDKYMRMYYEGQIELSKLRQLHHSLVAQSCQRAGQSHVPREPASKAPQSRIGSDPAGWDLRDTKATSLAFLGEFCRKLGMEIRAQAYELRARLEGATARVLKAYEKRPECQGVQSPERKEPADLPSSFGRLERAGRVLDDYNLTYARAMIHLRACREFESEIQKLDSSAEHHQFDEMSHQRDIAVGLAEKATFAAVSFYKSFQAEIRLAREEYDALSRSMSTNPLQTTKAPGIEVSDTSEILRETKGDLEGPGRMAVETKVTETMTKELDPHEPELPESRQSTGSNSPVRNLAASVVVGEILRELDRGI
jgi:hypothetical protein